MHRIHDFTGIGTTLQNISMTSNCVENLKILLGLDQICTVLHDRLRPAEALQKSVVLKLKSKF